MLGKKRTRKLFYSCVIGSLVHLCEKPCNVTFRSRRLPFLVDIRLKLHAINLMPSFSNALLDTCSTRSAFTRVLRNIDNSNKSDKGRGNHDTWLTVSAFSDTLRSIRDPHPSTLSFKILCATFTEISLH